MCQANTQTYTLRKFSECCSVCLCANMPTQTLINAFLYFIFTCSCKSVGRNFIQILVFDINLYTTQILNPQTEYKRSLQMHILKYGNATYCKPKKK